MDIHQNSPAETAGAWNVVPISRQPPIDDAVLNGEILGSGIALRDTPTLLEEQKLQAVLSLYPQETLEPKHHFAPGMYGRELFMKAGTLIVGKIHKHEHLAIMVYGDITVYSPKEGKKRLKGHHIMVSPAETKRVVYPHADTLWITVHASDSRDLEQLEKELITPEDPALIEELAREYLASLPEIAA